MHTNLKISIFNYIVFLCCLLTTLNAFSGSCITRNDSLLISRQSQLDSFPIIYNGCDRVNGKLIIAGNNITNLHALNNLKYIDLLVVRDNPILRSLDGLGNIQLARNIEISHNNSLLSLNGLGKLDSVNTSFEIKYNSSLITLDGINSIKKVGNTLSVFSNESLSSLDGLESLEIANRLSIYGNPLLISLLGIDSNINLKIIDIWVNEQLSCCDVVKKIKNRNPSISLTNIFLNNSGCNSSAEIINSTGTQNCCKTEFAVNNVKICAGQSISINNNIYSNPGIYIDSLTAISGCDSVLYTNLSIGNPSFTKISKTLCSGQTFTLSNGLEVDREGSYIDTIPFTCDSVVEYRLNFIENELININRNLCEGQKLRLPGGRIVDSAGIYTDTVSISGFCDSIFVTRVNFFPNTFSVSLKSEYLMESGDSIQLKPFYTNGTGNNWIWKNTNELSCNTCESPYVKPNRDSYYEVLVKAENGCEDTALVHIKVKNNYLCAGCIFSQ